MTTETEEKLLAQVCPEISALLNSEELADSHVQHISRGFFDLENAIWVKIWNRDATRFSFVKSPENIPTGVAIGFGDPQSGYGDYYHCQLHNQMLIAK